MRRTTLTALLGALALAALACEGADTLPEGGGDATAGRDGDGPAAGGGSITAEVRLAKDFPNQLVALFRPYVTAGSKYARGDLYAQLCGDPDCATGGTTRLAAEDVLLSTGFPTEVTVSGVPAGTFHVRFVLDSEYSQDYDGAWNAGTGFGALDVVQAAGADPRPAEGQNLPPATTRVTIPAGGSGDAGPVVLGSLLFSQPAFPATTERGWLLVAASGDGSYRNHVKVVDLETMTVAAPAVPQQDGQPFPGDICGFVRGAGQQLYVLGVGAKGAYVMGFNLATRAFQGGAPVWIPHPGCADETCDETLSAEGFPWPCRGVTVARGDRAFLYLIEYKGAGAAASNQAYALTVVDVTDLPAGGGQLVATYGAGDHPFVTTRRIFRGVAAIGETVYLVEPSWSNQLADDTPAGRDVLTTIYALPTAADGTVDWDARTAATGGTADDACGSTNHWAPGFAAAPLGGAERLFLGNDDFVTIHDATGAETGRVDTRGYGSLVTSFAPSPDGTRLYALPNCKSATKKAHVRQGVGDRRTDLDRHAVAVLDLRTAGATPALLHGDRDFDEDGTPDGGVDLEFLYLKRDLLRWCETCTGVVPPTAYVGPEIAAGAQSLFLRGSGSQSDELNANGLGQVADVGVYDLATGRGVVFRDYNVWLDGPSSRWGFDLDPATVSRSYRDDVSTAAILYLPK